MDGLNWQLWELRGPRKETHTSKGDGSERWFPCGRYYSYNTLPAAFEYAADCDLKAAEGTVSPAEFLDAWSARLGAFEKSILDAFPTS